MFDKHMIYRIPIANLSKESQKEVLKQDLKIICTFISSNHRLYALVFKDRKFRLHQIGVQFKGTNFNTDDFEKRLREGREYESFMFGDPILEYDEDQTFNGEKVELEDAFQLFVRDAELSTMGSRKKCFAFILHGTNLIYWMQENENVKGEKVLLVQENVRARRLR